MNYYKQENISGDVTKYTRATFISINNAANEIPKINFMEEELTILPNGDTNSRMSGMITELFDSPEAAFNLVNPTDGTVIGSATHQDLYVLLYSLYLDLATKRDNKLQQ